MQRLRKNQGRYNGETIDIEAVVRDIKSSALHHGWELENYSLTNTFELCTLYRPGSQARKSVYISTGIHGDEPSGPLAIRQLMQDNHWPEELSIWLCPCLNPTGFPLNTRENSRGIDQNRDYRHLHTEETRTHVKWLQQKPDFDLALCLHEDWEAQGFYVYEQNPENRPSLACAIIEEAKNICPIDNSESIDNWPASNGIIRPKIPPEQREHWPEALFLISNKTRQGYTLETPSDFDLPLRVQTHVVALKAALAEFVRIS